MKKFVLVLVSALSLFAAQAQEKVTYVTVKAIDGEEYVTPVTDIDEITFRTTNVYTVTFDTDGGSEVDPQKVDEGKTVERPEDPTKNGFSFENWYNGKAVYDFTKPVKENLTLTAQWKRGFVAKPFSVSAKRKVYFSPGNLQYQASTHTWRFAENQYDIIGADNAKVSPKYNGWIDLFGWGTADNPTENSMDNVSEYDWDEWGDNIDDREKWYTMTDDEWLYFHKNHVNKWLVINLGKGNIVTGRVYLPDNAEIDIDASWEELQAAGAVFLPTAGYREGTNVLGVRGYGSYWTCVPNEDEYAYYFFVTEDVCMTSGDMSRGYGRAVRLVRDVK